MRIQFIVTAFASVLAVAMPAHAQMVVDKLWLDLNAKTPSGDILVRNESQDRYYVSISTARVDNPGGPKETRATDSDPEKLGLLTTPNRVVLDPGAQRSIRVVSIGDAATSDRVYRVLIAPAVGDLTTTGSAADSRGLAIKVLTAYEALIIVRAQKQSASIEADRTPTELKLHNTGDTATLLYNFSACRPQTPADAKADAGNAVSAAHPASAPKPAPIDKPAGADATDSRDAKCEHVGAIRLYAGNTASIPLATPGEPVTMDQQTLATDDPVHLKF